MEDVASPKGPDDPSGIEESSCQVCLVVVVVELLIEAAERLERFGSDHQVGPDRVVEALSSWRLSETAGRMDEQRVGIAGARAHAGDGLQGEPGVVEGLPSDSAHLWVVEGRNEVGEPLL